MTTTQYVEYRAGGGGASSIAIGGNVSGGTDTAILFVHPTGVLAQDPTHFSYSYLTSVLTLSNAPVITAFGTAGVVHNAANGTLSSSTIVNADVSASAAIAYSKLSLTGSIVNADINASAAIAYSKLSLTGSIVNADINASAAIVYSKLSLTGSIVNADVSSSAAIAYSKLNLSASIVNADIAPGAAIAYAKLNLTGAILNADINASAAIAYSKLALSGSIVNADINASAAIAYSKLNLATSIVNADINASAAIAYSKLNLTGAILNADINASAAIAYSKLNLATSIVNADINASAAIAGSKIVVATGATAGVVDGNAATWNGLKSFAGGIITGTGGSANSTGDSNLGTISSVQWTAYYEGSFSASFGNAWNASHSITVKYVKIGKVVTLQFPESIFAAGSPSAASINTAASVLPSGLVPAATKKFPTSVYNNAAASTIPGVLAIFTDGSMYFYRQSDTTTAYTVTANCGWYGDLSVTYTLN